MCVLFKQKPAYEMRISDWSSDVCSSDLPRVDARAGEIEPLGAAEARADDGAVFAQTKGEAAAGGPRFFGGDRRAEERVLRIVIVDPRRGDQVAARRADQRVGDGAAPAPRLAIDRQAPGPRAPPRAREFGARVDRRCARLQPND